MAKVVTVEGQEIHQYAGYHQSAVVDNCHVGPETISRLRSIAPSSHSEASRNNYRRFDIRGPVDLLIRKLDLIIQRRLGTRGACLEEYCCSIVITIYSSAVVGKVNACVEGEAVIADS